MSKPAGHEYEFGPFRLDPTRRLLLEESRVVPLTSKAFDILLALVESNGQILEKDEILERVWPGTAVEEKNLTVNISSVRKALGESPNDHRYIVTVPGRGYRFVADVREMTGGADLIVKDSTVATVLIEEQEDRLESEESALEIGKTSLPTSGPDRLMAKRRIFVLCALTVVAAGVALYFWISSRARQADAGLAGRSIAVLPFRPLGAEGSDEYLGLGMADALITKLSNIKEITVRPTSAIVKYAAAEQDLVATGRDLEVDALLDGRVQILGDRIRVTVQLVNASDGRPLWAEKFDERFTDIFRVQDSISENVAEALIPKLTGEQRRLLAKRYTDNTEAYQSYLKGRYFWSKRSEQNLKKAIEFFEQAIKQDPDYTLGHVGLADSYSVLGWYGRLRPADAYPQARHAAAQALKIDDRLGEAHAAMGLIKANYDWDWAGAEAEYKRAIALNPGYPTVHQWYGQLLAMLGRHEESIAELERAREIDPVSPVNDAFTGQVLYFARQPERAVEQLRKAVEIDQDFFFTHLVMGWAYDQKKQFAEAVAELQKASRLDDFSLITASLGYTYAAWGKRAEAMKMLQRLKELSSQRYVAPFHLALIYVGLGEKDQALAWLEKAYEDRSVLLQWLKVDPKLDSLRSDQRFASLLVRMGL